MNRKQLMMGLAVAAVGLVMVEPVMAQAAAGGLAPAVTRLDNLKTQILTFVSVLAAFALIGILLGWYSERIEYDKAIRWAAATAGFGVIGPVVAILYS